MSENYDKTFGYFYHSQMKNCKGPYSSFLTNLTLSYKNKEQNTKDSIKPQH